MQVKLRAQSGGNDLDSASDDEVVFRKDIWKRTYVDEISVHRHEWMR